ncbi:MAG: hypothetical protein ABIH23_25315, partial [bacterium]
EMLEALEKQEIAEADLCKTYCDRHSEEYLAKQKRLEPYLNKARECRTQFVIEKRKIYQFELELADRGEEILCGQIQELLYHDKEGKTTQNLLSLAEGIRSLAAEGRPAFDGLTDHTPEELEEQSSTFVELDKKYLAPLFNKTIEFVDAFQQAWRHFVEGVPVQSSQKATSKKILEDVRREPAASRMAYQEKVESPDGPL